MMMNHLTSLTVFSKGGIMFGFTYPAWCMVCMVSGVHFRWAGICVMSASVGLGRDGM